MNLSITQQKSALRKEILAWRKALPPDSKSRMDGQILAQLQRLPEFRSARQLLVYCAMPQEIPLWPVIHAALEAGIPVAAPRCGAPGEMQFHLFTHLEQLHPGIWGILEPDASAPVLEVSPEYSLCLVPALAADRQGFRLGYGGGYYDRFLARYTGTTAALLYSPWLAETVPAEPFDQQVDILITPDGIFRRAL